MRAINHVIELISGIAIASLSSIFAAPRRSVFRADVLATFFGLAALAMAPASAQPPGVLPPPREGGAFVSPDVVEALQTRNGASVDVLVVFTSGLDINADEYVSYIAAQGDVIAAATRDTSFLITQRYSHLPVLAGTLAADGLAALESNPLVTHINLNRIMTKSDIEAHTLIRDDTARMTYGVTGENVYVSVIDSGIDSDHPDFIGRIHHQACFVDCPAAGSTEDVDGHGTHVSGIITGPNGVAPAAKINALRIFGSRGGASNMDVMNALNYILAKHETLKTNIVNMSFSGEFLYDDETSCNDANGAFVAAVALLRSRKISVFAATGNDSSTHRIPAPSCVTGVIAVGSVNDANTISICPGENLYDQVSCYSNTTPVQGVGELVDLLAPGCEITSSALGGGQVTACGTSMASPMAAGVAALMLSVRSDLSPDEIEVLLEAHGDPIYDYRIAHSPAYPRVNALATLLALHSDKIKKFKVTVLDSERNKLKWKDAVDETAYAVQRSADGLNFITIATLPADITKYVDSDGQCGTQYFRVYKIINGKHFTSSKIRSVMNRPCPKRPKDLRQISFTPTSLTLIWKDNVSDETGYLVERRVNSAFGGVQMLPPNTTSYTHTFPACEISTYRVRTVRNEEISAPSATLQISPCAPANDTAAGATLITDPVYIVLQDDAVYATTAPDDPPLSCLPGGATGASSVWHKITPSADGLLLDVALAQSTGNYSHTALAILTRTAKGWKEVACDSGYLLDQSFFHNVPVYGGVTYYILAVRNALTDNSAPGTMRLKVESQIPPSVDLLRNGSFEDDIKGWSVNNVTGDSRRCKGSNGFAFVGRCAFVFQGSINETSVLKQVIKPDGMTPISGDTLTLTARTKAAHASAAGTLTVVIKYTDGTPNTKLNAALTPSGEYLLTAISHTLTTAPVKKITVIIKHSSIAGKLYLDGTSLLYRSAGSTRQNSQYLPLPDAPSGFKRIN